MNQFVGARNCNFDLSLSQVGDNFSQDVMQSFSFGDNHQHHHTTLQQQNNVEQPSGMESKGGPILQGGHGKGRNSIKEPDSGISSAISSTTRPWSQNESIEADQVN